MPTHAEKRILPYKPQQMFDLVAAVDLYPQFLPWCIGARINEKKRNNLTADVIVGYKVFREKFSSRVHFEKDKAIDVEYLQGPMSHLQNKWKFREIKGGKCEVQFYVDFSLKTKLFESLVDQFFHKVLIRMIDAFEHRAEDLYG